MFLRISFVLEHCCWFIFHLTFQGWQMAHSNSLKCADRMCSTGIGDSVISSYQCHGEKNSALIKHGWEFPPSNGALNRKFIYK
jgi:hypothetical protein